MFKWLKKSKKKAPSGKVVRKSGAQDSKPSNATNATKQTSAAEKKLKRLGVLKQSEQDTVRAIRKYIRDNPKQAAQLIKLWLELAEQRQHIDKI